MKSILVLGVTPISDSYPNVKYKLAALAEMFGEKYVDAVIRIEGQPAFASIAPGGKPGRLGLAWKLTWGHLREFYRSLRHRSDVGYICYPGIVLANWLGLPFVRSRYKALYLDAFISLYDTIVRDRRLLKAGNPAAKLLFAMEKRAFTVATAVIVDTPENAQYYSELFDVPLARFHAVPLSIPSLPAARVARRKDNGAPMRCVFIGTFVPLQGVPVIVDAVRLLADDPDIEFVFVGDGQDAHCLEDYIESSATAKVTWHRGHYPTDFLVEQIRDADVCLGVFGAGKKTQRVLPYKLYYYLALAAPVVTATSLTVERLSADCAEPGETPPLAAIPAGDATALAAVLRHYRDHRAELVDLGHAGRRYYECSLSDAVIREQLAELFRATGAP